MDESIIAKKPKKLSRKKKCCAGTSLCCGIGFVISGILVVTIFTGFVNNFIRSQTPLKKESDIAKSWQKPPIVPYLKFYFFNVTNPQEFLQNSSVKPILEEIGPFVYQEVWEKTNVTWNGEEVSYGQDKTFFFKKELSYGGEDIVLKLPNIPMLTSLALMKRKPFVDSTENDIMIRTTPSALKSHKQTQFVQISVSGILWGSENPLLEMAEGMFANRPDLLFPHDKFGIFVGKNGTNPGIMTAKTGINEHFNEIGRVISFNHKRKLDFWKNEGECNDIKGTDGSSFPPDISPNATLYLFNRDLCRSIPLVKQEDVISSGVPGFRFVPPEDIFSPPEDNPDNACFCMADGGCQEQPKGVFNMSACQYGSPIMMSWPHFFQADPQLLDAVEGLKPDQAKHQFFMDIQPKLGVALKAQARSQINIQMYKMDGVEVAEGLRDMIFPVLWFESGIDGIKDEHTLDLLQTAIYMPEKAKKAMIPTFFVVGCLLVFVVAFYLGYVYYYKPRNQTQPQIIPTFELKLKEEGQENNEMQQRNVT